MGTLESLQNSIYERLRGASDLRLADIKKEGANDDGGKANGLRITVGRPLPKTASKYAAGPTFSEVELRVEVSRADPIAANAPSLLSAAETVSKSLHNWTPPLAFGYGRMTLAPQYPWISKDGKISIILNAQSVLQ